MVTAADTEGRVPAAGVRVRVDTVAHRAITSATVARSDGDPRGNVRDAPRATAGSGEIDAAGTARRAECSAAGGESVAASHSQVGVSTGHRAGCVGDHHRITAGLLWLDIVEAERRA